MPQQESPRDKEPSTARRLVALDRYWQLAVLLPAATFVGWGFGVLLDRWLHTTWIYLVGLVLGIVAGFVQMFRLVLSSKDEP